MNRANCDVVVLFLVSQFSPRKIASHSCWPKVLYVLTARVSWADNEVEHVVNVGIDSRYPLLATANTPGHKSYNIPSTSLGLANQWSSTITIAGVFLRLAPSADLRSAQSEVSCVLAGVLQSSPHGVVASVEVNQWDVNLVLNEVEIAINGVLAPTGHPASDTSSVVIAVAEHVPI